MIAWWRAWRASRGCGRWWALAYFVVLVGGTALAAVALLVLR